MTSANDVKTEARVSWSFRLMVFAFLWLVAGLAAVVFADYSPENGSSKLTELWPLVLLAPLHMAGGLAFAAVGDNGHGNGAIQACALGLFLAHAIVILSRKSRRQLALWTVIQFIFLSVSVVSVLCMWHWDALNGHG